MTGERDPYVLLKAMSPRLDDGIYVFALIDNDVDRNRAIMVFHESEGDTAIISKDYADARNLHRTFACRMITLQVHSALDAVGYLARILPTLSAAGIATNVVSAFHHDHIFVPEDKAIQALAVLEALSTSA